MAHLYKIPLLMLISYRGELRRTRPLADAGRRRDRAGAHALGIPWERLDHPAQVAGQVRQAQTLADAALKPVALLLSAT